jgi:hypothetical protein
MALSHWQTFHSPSAGPCKIQNIRTSKRNGPHEGGPLCLIVALNNSAQRKINQAFVKRCARIITFDIGEFPNFGLFATAFAQRVGVILLLSGFRDRGPEAGRHFSVQNSLPEKESRKGQGKCRVVQCKVLFITVFSMPGFPK